MAHRQFQTQFPRLLCVEGGIGVGKSTALYALRQLFDDDDSVVFVDEPVAAWERVGLLPALYSGEVSRATFQLTALGSRFGPLQRAVRRPGTRLVICERSPYTDYHVFAKCNLAAGSVDRRAYELVYSELLRCLPPNLQATFVYLKAPADLLAQRIERRGREAETRRWGNGAQPLPLSYLAALECAHDAYFEGLQAQQVYRVDGRRPTHEVVASVGNIALDILAKAGPLPVDHGLLPGAGLVSMVNWAFSSSAACGANGGWGQPGPADAPEPALPPRAAAADVPRLPPPPPTPRCVALE